MAKKLNRDSSIIVEIIERLKELTTHYPNVTVEYITHIEQDKAVINFNDFQFLIKTDDIESVPATLISRLSNDILALSETYNTPLGFIIMAPDVKNGNTDDDYDEYDYDYDDYDDTTSDYVFYTHDIDYGNSYVEISYPHNPSLNGFSVTIHITDGDLKNVDADFPKHLKFDNEETVNLINNLLNTEFYIEDPAQIEAIAKKHLRHIKKTLPIVEKYSDHVLKGQVVANTSTYLTFIHEYQGGIPTNETNLVLKLDTAVANYDVINDGKFTKQLDKAFPGYLLINSTDGFDLPNSRPSFNQWKYRDMSTGYRPWSEQIGADAFWERYLGGTFTFDFLRTYDRYSSGVGIQLKLTGECVDKIIVTGHFDNEILGFDKDGELILSIHRAKPLNKETLKSKINALLTDLYSPE